MDSSRRFRASIKEIHDVVYKSTIDLNSYFNLTINMNTFAVFHWVQNTNYDSWMNVGAIGGFGYFMFVAHTILMGLISLCLTPNSKLLSGDNTPYQSSGNMKYEPVL